MSKVTPDPASEGNRDAPPGARADRLSDEDLVRRIREGDESAARELFDRHLPSLRAKVAARLPSSVRGKVGASDVVQETWLSAFLALGEFRDHGDGSFAAWLRRIVERKVSDEVRRHARVKKRSARREVRWATGADGLEPDVGQATPSQIAGDDERAATLRAAVAALDPDHAAVIRLVHEEGLTLVEAGRRMGRSPDAARMLYGRAIQRLAERLPPPPSAGGA